MKLNIKSLLICSILCLTTASCDDFLDRQEDESMTFEKIWMQFSTTRQYFSNAMSFLPNDADEFNYSPWMGASDEGSVTYNRESYRWMNFGSWNANSVPYEKMTHYYQGIRECNILIQNVMSCTDPVATQQQLKDFQTSARWARAYYYFLMMRIYGPVYLVGDELIDFTLSTEALQRQRNTWEECVNYVVSEMNECAALLPEKWEETNYGLPTKGTCYAVISRLQLYAARDLFNGNTLYKDVKNPDGTNLFPTAYDAQKWVVAAQAAKKVVDMGIYKLYRKGNGNPYEDYAGIIDVLWNSELIWTTGYKGRYTVGVHTAPTGIGGAAYGGVGPTQQQVDAYAMNNGIYPITGYGKDGTPAIDERSGYTEEGKSQFNNPAFSNGGNNYDYAPAQSGYEWPNMYKDREPRFYMTVFWSDSYWKAGNTYTLISFAKNGNSNKSHDYPKSGYLMHRFYDHSSNSQLGTWGNICFPTFRLGEIYLNYIEAVLECKKRGANGSGVDYAKAMELWNDLRDRAGVPAIEEAYPNASIDELIELCRRERRVELAFENHRYFDTRTWMIAEQTDGGDMYGMNALQTTDKLNATPDEFWKRVVFETRVFKKNHYLYPFAQRELDRNKLLTQNYGW